MSVTEHQSMLHPSYPHCHLQQERASTYCAILTRRHTIVFEDMFDYSGLELAFIVVNGYAVDSEMSVIMHSINSYPAFNLMMIPVSYSKSFAYCSTCSLPGQWPLNYYQVLEVNSWFVLLLR